MNNPIAQISTAAKNIFKGNRTGGSYERYTRPERQWLLGIVVALVLVGSLAAWSVAIYLGAQSSSDIGGAATEISLPNYNASMVEQAEAIFKEREVIFASVAVPNVPVQEPTASSTVSDITIDDTALSSATTTVQLMDEDASVVQELVPREGANAPTGSTSEPLAQ